MDDTFGNLMQRFGYFAVGFGTFLEGETALILGSLLVIQGHLSLVWVIGAAALGAFVGDLVAYYLGVWKIEFLLKKFSFLNKIYPRVMRFFKRYGSVSVFVARFFYGLRVPTGIFCGMTRMKISHFATIALIGCSLWAILWCCLGLAFGHSLSLFIKDIQEYEKYILIAGFIILIGISILRRIRANAKMKTKPVAVVQQTVAKADLTSNSYLN